MHNRRKALTSNHLNPIHSIAQQQIGAIFANETETHPIPEHRLPRTVPPSADRQRWVDDFRIRGPSPAVARPHNLLMYSFHILIDNLSHTPAKEILIGAQNEDFVRIFDKNFDCLCVLATGFCFYFWKKMNTSRHDSD